MKRILLWFIIFAYLAIFITTPLFANAGKQSDADTISREEDAYYMRVIECALKSTEYQTYLLYDCDDSPNYVLCTTNSGYMIIRRNTDIICECGEKNPFEDYMDMKKYYGGALLYFVDGDDYSKETGSIIQYKYWDFIRCVEMDRINTMLFHEEEKEDSVSLRDESNIVSNDFNYIRRRAYGYNNDNTCSAIACAIALNYIKNQHGINVVMASQTSEYYNYGLANGPSYIELHYPKAYSLHRSLVDDYGMGAVSFGSGIVNPLSEYLEDRIPNSAQRPTISYTLLPKYSTIKTNINQNKPVLITSTIAGDYSWHTMVVYGYKTEGNNNLLLVHTGWHSPIYNSPIVTGSACYYHNQIWINKSYATYGYCFTLPTV